MFTIWFEDASTTVSCEVYGLLAARVCWDALHKAGFPMRSLRP